MSLPNKITVVYLLWVPAGIDPLKDFVRSYRQFSAGMEHDLCVVVKDSGGDKEKEETLIRVLLENEISFHPLYMEGGLDIDAYFFAAGKIDSEYLFFLNTSSLILDNQWLKKYSEAFILNNAGIISASSSCQSYYSTVYQLHSRRWETKKGWKFNINKYKLFIKAFFYWRFLFKSFPNPHIRTNAFMVRKKDFLGSYRGPVNNKFKAYCFESGRKGITGYFLKKGLKVLVVDKYGRTYGPEQWAASSTFRIRLQENLLVADNQTRIYELADEENKRSMTKLSWGDQ